MINIRAAESHDFASVYSFINELENFVFDEAVFRGIFERNIARANIIYLVANVEGNIVGFVSCHIQELLHHNGSVAEIQELFVEEKHRNQRIGEHLINHLKTLLLQQNIFDLEVTTNRIRTSAHRFYEKNGFSFTHKKFVCSLKN